MPRTRSARAAAVAAATGTSANPHSSTSDVKISTSSILKGATLDDSFFEAPNSTTSPTSSTSFTFDLRVSEFPGTPGDVNGNQEANPFFHRFEEDTSSSSNNNNSTNSPSDGQRLSPSLLLPAFETDWDATLRQRHRTFNRVSFSSSVASSAPSTAASETGEESTDADWESSNFTAMRHQVDGGLSEAFEQQHLAGPCSFSDHQYDPSNDAHQNQPSHEPMSNNVSASQHQRGISIPSFNLEDFISDAEQQHVNDVPVSYEEQHNTQSNDLSSSWHTENSSVSDSGHFGAAANAEMLAALEGSMLPHQRRETSDSTGSAFSGSSSVASPPSPTTPGSTNADAYQREVVSQHSSPFFSPARCATTSNVARSMSFNGQPSPSFAHQQAQAQHHQQQQQQHLQSPQQLFLGTQRVVAASPVQHPSLLRVGGGMPQTPVRSQSTSNLPSMYDNNLSCNPAYITPGDAAVAVAGLATPLEGHHQGYFQAAHRSDFPDSPASSAYSSPLRWTSALPSDDGAGEDTYRDSGYGCNGAASSAGVLSSSLPTRSALLSVGSAMPGPNMVPVSPSLAGQPMRPGRSSMQSSPYAVPTEAPHHQHHLLPPSHPLSHLHNPYSGVITKRSRGRRVPITPEEMTNVGKSGKVYTCKVPGCGKLFKRSEHLKRHIRSIHTDEKPFTCQICHKRFSRHDNLNQHMRVHGPAAVAALAAATAAQQESGGALGDYASSASSFGEESSPAGSPLSTSFSVRRHSFLSQGSSPHFDPYEAQLQHQEMRQHHQQGGGNGTIKGRRQTNASAPTLDSEVFDFDDGMSAGGVEDGDVQLFSL